MRGAPHGTSGYSGGAGRARVYYYCEGPVRGSCGHRHRTVSGALLCLELDKRACRSAGGYSDRYVYRVTPKGVAAVEVRHG